MKIARLRIQNWKSFSDTGELGLTDINIIVGRNNTGKSALLRAVHWMQASAIQEVGDVRLGEKRLSLKLCLVVLISPPT